MWRLTERTAHRRRGDDGVTMILVAVSAVALIGIGALVVDVGALVQERRTLQNGADAAALAVAADCARGACGAAAATAATYANANADDGVSTVDSVCGVGPGLSACASPPAGVSGSYVMVTTSTRSTGGGNTVNYVFGQTAGAGTGKTVRRTAVATWGRLGKATTVPMTISSCDYNALVGNPPKLPTGTVQIYFHGTGGVGQPSCPRTVPNTDSPLPGGFGYLETEDGCSIEEEHGNWVEAAEGNSFPRACDPRTWQNKDVLVPIYDATRGFNGNAGNGGDKDDEDDDEDDEDDDDHEREYHIAGFAVFTVTGYKLQGSGNLVWNMPGNKCPKGNGSSAVCLQGVFKTFVAFDGELTTTGANFGVAVVKLVS